MADTILKNILSQYNKKKIKAEYNAEIRKQEIYNQNPKLQEIDNKLTSLAISTTMSLINKNDKNKLEELNNNINKLKEEKNKILKSINISPDYFDPNYECKICKDSGYITNTDYTTSMCSCLKQKLYDEQYNKTNISTLNTQNFDNFCDLYYSDEVNESKYHTNISPRENINLIKDICFKFIENFDNSNQKNLLFTGNTGLGKTFLSSAIANEIIKKGKNVLYQTAPVMLDSIIDFRFGKSKDSDIINSILNVDLLIIDDLGTEAMNSAKFSELFNILNTRILRNKKILISTNLTPQEIKREYEERIFSRFVGDFIICRFVGEDIRILKKKMMK